MSRTINRVELLGRVGAEPEMRYTPNGTAVTHLRVATDRPRQNGETETDWHTVTVWDKLGEAVNQYVEKGQRIYVAGRLAQNSYEAKDGNRRYSTEIYAAEVVFLDGGGNNGSANHEPSEYEDGVEPGSSPF